MSNKHLVEQYLEKLDWRVNENSNNGDPTFSGLMLYLSNTEIAKYALKKIYPENIATAHSNADLHIHDLSYSLCVYCCGWSLEQLIKEGINKIKGKASSAPARHLSSLMIQMVNFLGCTQMESAGAQAFNNVDTYLAPFVKIDKLSYYEVKQYMQQLVFNLNIPSRWGCLSEDSEILTKNGWKYFDEIEKNELIATFNIEDNCMEYQPIQKMNIYDYDGELINFKNRKVDILMTPNHRTVFKKFNSKDTYLIKQADELYNYKTPISIPLAKPLKDGKETITNDMVRLYAWIIAEGTIPKNNGQKDSRITITQSEKHNPKYCEEIRNILKNCNIDFYEKITKSGFTGEYDCVRFILNRLKSRELNEILDKNYIPESILNSTIIQKNIFIDTYIKADGCIEKNGRKRITTISKTLKDDLMQIILETGQGVDCYYRPLEKCSEYSKNPQYLITIYEKNHATITQKGKIQYKGKVWCPTVENSTFIARRKGTAFITGNCQPPFVNFTFDIKCPQDMEAKLAIVGGVEQDFTYGQCQEEMDLINQAFIEVMEEGDSDGQVHTFPIPTYNIDRNFDWNSSITDKLFEMTAKYGVPYFANYVGSDMDSTQIRSMCPLTKDTMIPFKVNDEKVKVADIDYIFRNYKDETIKVWTNNGWRVGKPIQMEMTTVYKITLQDNIEIKMGENHLQPVLNEGIQKAKDLLIGDWLPFCKKPLKSKSEYEYRKIINKEEIETNDKYLYCFEVDSEDQLFMLDSGLITHNCRLRLDLSELRKRGGGFFGAGDKTGSIGVVTINLPRIGYLAKSIPEFFEMLDKQLLLAKESLDIKRKIINKNLEAGLFPYIKRYLGTFDNHFSTIGIIGMNETLLNFIGKDVGTQEGNEFANQILDYINKKLSEFQRTSPDQVLYNLEATPAEGTSYRFAKHDKEKYPDIITAGSSETPYYTNSVHLPVDYTDDIFKVLELEDELQSKFTSGTVIHFYLGEQVENPKALKELTKKIVENYTLPYFSFTPTFSTCIDHGYIKGEVYNCPKCDKETLIWSRVTGYLRPVSSYNIGKKEEFKQRRYYKL